MSDSDNQPTPNDDIDPIPADQARALLNDAIRERLGPKWDDAESGWIVVSRHDYMARLTRGGTNMDFYVDLLGNVSIEEKEISPAQETGRIFAWMLLLGSLFIALLLAWIAGLFN